MADHENKIVDEFTVKIAQLAEQTAELQAVLGRTLKALAKHGVQLSVDLEGMTSKVLADVNSLKQKSQSVVHQLDQQRELVHTVALITSSLDLDQVLNEIMDRIIHLTGAERAYLMLREDSGEEFTIRAARNWDQEDMSGEDINFSRTLVNQAFDKMTPIVATNAQDEFSEMESVLQHGLRSILVIPLALHGRVVGVLYADNRIEDGIFSQDEVPVLTAFGTQAAIAIANAKQFEQVKVDLVETRRELEVLRVQIDEQKVRQQVAEITDDEFFERLYATARVLRQQKDNLEG